MALQGAEAVAAFVKEHLYAEELRITDTADELIFHAVDGIDLFSRLDELGIDLPALYDAIRREAVAAESAPEQREREDWEALYDSIGLTPAEVSMRQAAKRAARAARTVADVVSLLEGTYFDADFQSEDGSQRWDCFDPRSYSALVRSREGKRDRPREVRLNPQARVRHLGSGEDVHLFVLLDPPEDS